jgi:hypothetical protein
MRHFAVRVDSRRVAGRQRRAAHDRRAPWLSQIGSRFRELHPVHI